MQAHEVPTHVQAEDRVLLWFTFPQIVALTAVAALAYGAYSLAPFGPSGVRLALAILIALAGVAAVAGCSRTTTSAWTGRCWRRGPRSRATAPGTSRSRPRGQAVATPRWTSGGGDGAGRRTSRAWTPKRASTARAPSRRRS